MGVLRTFFTVDLKARVAARPPGDVPPLFRSGALSICGSNSSIKTHRRFGRRWAIALRCLNSSGCVPSDRGSYLHVHSCDSNLSGVPRCRHTVAVRHSVALEMYAMSIIVRQDVR